VTGPIPHQAGPGRVVFSPDGRRVSVAGPRQPRAVLWDAVTGQPRVTLPQSARLWDLAFSPDGRHVAGGSADYRARVWDAETGELRRTLEHAGWVVLVAFSPDGRRLLRAGHEGTASLREVKTGELLVTLRHRSFVNDAAFSGDGRLVVTASQDHTARVWDAATGDAVTPPLRHAGAVFQAAFSPDRGRVVTTSRVAQGPREVRVWDLRADDRPAADLVPLAQALAARGLTPEGALRARDVPGDTWQALRRRYPADFGASREQALAWHHREATTCE
jgi:WD40 repeat protein